jgi:APA family basic amino acid/polyamine antiporter
MTTARVFYAMAKDKLFFKNMGSVHPKYRTPGKSLILQCTWACLLTLTGTYDQIFTYVIFAGWIFYALGAAGIFLMRKKMPDAQPAYRVPLYPIIPILFVIVATWFVFNTVVEQTDDSLVGFLLLLTALPFYYYWQRSIKQSKAA